MTTSPSERANEREAIDKRREVAREQQSEDVKWLMSHAQGRRLMWGLLSDFGLYRTPFTGETNRTNFNLGEHNAALRLHAMLLDHAADECDLMSREARPAPRAVAARKSA